MKLKTKLKLAAVYQLCAIEDRSTEYTIQYLQDMCKVSFDCVIAFLNFPINHIEELVEGVNELINFLDDNFAEDEE